MVSEQFERPLNFVVLTAQRDSMRSKILDAMRVSEVMLFVRRVVDRTGLPTSVLLISLDLNLDAYEVPDDVIVDHEDD